VVFFLFFCVCVFSLSLSLSFPPLYQRLRVCFLFLILFYEVITISVYGCTKEF